MEIDPTGLVDAVRCRYCGHWLKAHGGNADMPCMVQICECVSFAKGDGTERPR